MENVPGMLSVDGMNYAEVVMEELAELGYRVGYTLLNAVWYGVPQFRERLFFIALRVDLGKSPKAPAMTHSAELSNGYRNPLREKTLRLPFGGAWGLVEGELVVPSAGGTRSAVDVSQALDDLPTIQDHLSGSATPRGDFRSLLRYPGEPHSDYSRLMRSWPGFPVSRSVSDHVVRRTPRDYETFRLMKHGDRYPEAVRIARDRFEKELDRLRKEQDAPSPGSEAWRKLESRFVPPYNEQDFPEKWRKLIPKQPSWTVPAHLAKDSYSHIHHDNSQARMISIREAARLQSFPDAFTFRGSMGDCFRQVGNAVPPLLSWAIASALLRLLGENPQEPPFAGLS